MKIKCSICLLRKGSPGNQRGFALVELMSAIAIGSLVIASVLAIMYNLFGITTSNSNYLAAFRQVQNSGNWITHDALMARKVMLDDPDTPATEFITLEWVTWEGDRYRVVYTLEDTSGTLKELKRTSNTSVDGGQENISVIARCIDPDKTESRWDADKSELMVKVTSQMGGPVLWGPGTWENTATRTYRILPRPLF